jgi:tetratricopeptide (TPR) repeat protein
MHYDRNWRAADATLRRALESGPADAMALRRAGVLAVCLNRPDEAIEYYSRALEQDPLSTATYNNLGYSYYIAGKLTDAERAYRMSLELAPARIGARAQLGILLRDQGRAEEALAEAGQEPQEVYRLWALASIYSAEGRESEYQQTLEELTGKYSEDAASQIAHLHAMHGNADAAFEWLERAYRQQDGGLAGMKSAPQLRSLAGDPRWAAFLLKMGFEA